MRHRLSMKEKNIKNKNPIRCAINFLKHSFVSIGADDPRGEAPRVVLLVVVTRCKW